MPWTVYEVLTNATLEQRDQTSRLLVFKAQLRPGYTFNAAGIVAYPHEPIAEDEVELAKGFIETFCHPTKRIVREHTSYFYKHCVEKAVRYLGEYAYCSNGAFIKAAVLLGYQAVQYKDTPNVLFNLRLPVKYARRMKWYYGYGSKRAK